MMDEIARGAPVSARHEETFEQLGDSLGALTSIAARLFQRALHERMQVHGAAFGQWPILMMLWHQDGVPQRELSRRIGVEAATLTRTIDRMERDGHVRRQRNPADRREVLVFLTDQGRALEEVLMPGASEVNAIAAEGLSDEEIVIAKRLLRHMIGRLIRNGLSRPGDIPECLARLGVEVAE